MNRISVKILYILHFITVRAQTLYSPETNVLSIIKMCYRKIWFPRIRSARFDAKECFL